MPRPHSILVCTDLSEASEFALHEALRWSAALRATLHIVHVVEPPVAADAVDITVSAHGQLAHRALLAIETAITRARVPDAVLGERWIRLGDPRDTILNVASQLGVELIALGTHGRTTVRRILLGSVAEQIARNAERPVLLSRAGAPGRAVPHERSLLAAVDLQPSSVDTLAYAFELANALGLHAHAMHAYAPLLVPGAAYAELSPHDDVHHSVLRQLGALVEPWRASSNVGKCIAAAGDPRWAIADTAEQLGSDLIVVGRNPPSLAQLALGEVHSAVLSRAPCSVLVVNHARRRA